MVSKESRAEVRMNKHRKIRNRFSGTAERPRLAVFRSNNHMYAQIIDDTTGNTLCAASSVENGFSGNGGNVEGARKVGEMVASVIDPIRQEKNKILADKAYMDKVLASGAERAYYIARKTLSKVYKKVGLVPLPRI